MNYMGSKRRAAKYLLPIMLHYRKPGQMWVEPFVGGANMIDKVTGARIGNDIHEYLIALLIAVRDGWMPPDNVSEELHRDCKKNPDKYPPELVGFVGFCCSFGGQWNGGFARNKCGRNYAEKGKRNLLKQAPNLKGIDFHCGNYWELEIPDNSLIYCDPPYQGTAGYRDKFDHDKFWQWCREKYKEGHTVFVSEYNAPDDFVCLTEKRQTTNLANSSVNAFTATERLFAPVGQCKHGEFEILKQKELF